MNVLTTTGEHLLAAVLEICTQSANPAGAVWAVIAVVRAVCAVLAQGNGMS